MSAMRALGQAFRREDDEPPVAARSRRDWTVDSVLFLLAAGVAVTSAVSSARHGVHGALLVADAAGAALACGALWWRRRRPLAVGLAVVAVMLVAPAAGVAGAVTLYSVAAYRRWPLACLVAGVQVALLPVAHAIQPKERLTSGVLRRWHLRVGGDRRLGHVPPQPPPGPARARAPR